MSSEAPDLMTRVRSRLRGEVSTEILLAYRRAGGGLHAMLDDLERQRFLRSGLDGSAWDVPLHVQRSALYLWNAFALQELADTLLEADAECDPLTVGFVPRVTADQARAYYEQVPVWVERSQRARLEPEFDLDVLLPARLPDWSPVEPCPRAHLTGLVAALRSLQAHLTAVMNAFEALPVPADREPEVRALRAQFGVLEAEVDALTRMYVPDASTELHELIEDRARAAVEKLYVLGQRLAMPSLPEAPPSPVPAPGRAQQPAVPDPSPAASGRGQPAGSPGKKGRKNQGKNAGPQEPDPPEWEAKPWLASDRRLLDVLRNDPAAQKRLKAMWDSFVRPEEDLALARELITLLSGDHVSYASWQGEALGHSEDVPFAPICVVLSDCTLNGTPLQTGDTFTLTVDGPARRRRLRVVIGEFEPGGQR